MFGPKIEVEFDRDSCLKIELDRSRNEKDDISKFVDWFGDNRIRQFLTINYPTIESAEADWFKNAATNTKQIFWFVYAENNLIGNISLMNLDETSGHAELGIAICDKNYWGMGIAPVIEATLIAYAFENIIPGGLNKIHAKAFAKNIRSIRALEKAGLKTVGIKKEQIWKNGQWHDEWLGEVLKKEWNKDQTFKNLGIRKFDLYPGCE